MADAPAAPAPAASPSQIYVPPLASPAPSAPAPASSSPSAPRGPSAAANPRATVREHWSDSLPRPQGAPTREQRGLPPGEPGAEPEPAAAPAAPSAAGKIQLGPDLEVTAEELTDLRARAAADATRKATIVGPESYTAELGPDFVAPPGLEYRLDQSDPMLARYRETAFAMGLDQAQFSEGLKMVASLRVAEAQAFSKARAAEVGKLGPNAAARVDAAVQFLKAVGGSKAAGLVDILKIAPVADTISAIEAMQATFRQNTGGFSQAHRATPPSDQRIQGYERMGFAERRAAQDALRRGNR